MQAFARIDVRAHFREFQPTKSTRSRILNFFKMRKRCFVPQMISIITKLDKPLKSFNCRAYRGLTCKIGEVINLTLGYDETWEKGFLDCDIGGWLIASSAYASHVSSGKFNLLCQH
ncbi:hypothetical protein BHE16_09235 [Neomicrococcus aestuarii]|uniref:Uncharacterized protein n=1 Tax=Neomicrococcus aestuarii TaxID=556325 RepID=A0A1L2ZQ42_9MICC|nr:hypothetical protein BHE16_09235 [Neomicrococcus aestuarii]